MKPLRINKDIHFLLVVVVGILLSIITLEIMLGRQPLIDHWSAGIVNDWTETNLYLFFRWVTELGSGTFVTPFILLFASGYYLFTKKIFSSMWVVLGVFLGYRINYWMKMVIERERPHIFEAAEGVGYSFPSGHAMGAMITYGLVLYLLKRQIKNKNSLITMQVIIVTLIIMIGFSRYIIQVHYLSDVLAGFGFGYLFLLVWLWLHDCISQRITRFFLINQ